MWNIIAKKQPQQKTYVALFCDNFPNFSVVIWRPGGSGQTNAPRFDTALFWSTDPKDQRSTDGKLQHMQPCHAWNFYPMEFCCGQNWALFISPYWHKLHVVPAFGFCKSLPLDRAGGGVSFGWECWPNYVPMASSAQRFQTMSLNLQPFHLKRCSYIDTS